MLGMKTLRVAIVTIGSALLLGPGFAAATVQELDGTGASAAVPVRFAQELLEVTNGNTLTAIAITNDHMAHKLVVSPRRAIEGTETSVYLRLSLGGGMTFSKLASDLSWTGGSMPAGEATCTYDSNTANEDPDATVVTYPAVLTGTGLPLTVVHSSGGSKGDDYAVFRLDVSGAADWDGDTTTADTTGLPLNTGGHDAADADPPTENTDDDPNNDVDDNNDSESCDIATGGKIKIWTDVKGYLAIPAGSGSYTASITMHSNPDQAQAGTSPSSALSGMATIVSAVSALDVRVKAADAPAIADVSTSPVPFLWFKDGAGNSSTANLGYAKADIGMNAAGALGPDGMAATADRLLGQGLLTFTIEGDFSIGAFNLTDPASCPATGTAGSPAMGNLMASEDGPASMRMLTGQDGGTYHLCVQVDVAGPGTNSTPIPAGNYNATITRGSGTLAKDLADGVIGVIKRNGASVNVTYLTVAEKYNQRLIIVNNGANDARYDIGPFVTEDGTTATPGAMASGMVGGGEQVVLRVEDIVSFSSADGRRHRASATVSLNAGMLRSSPRLRWAKLWRISRRLSRSAMASWWLAETWG